MTEEIYDLIIIGGGSAALSAGIYAGRAMMDTLIIEKDKIGGQVTTTSELSSDSSHNRSRTNGRNAQSSTRLRCSFYKRRDY